MLQEHFHQMLESHVGKKLQLKINNNRSTMLSVRMRQDLAEVSLHKMFLDAPQNVMDALKCYLKGDIRVLSPSIKAFIRQGVTGLHYPHTSPLHVDGKVYHLKKLYDLVNDEYFNQRLQLDITWFQRKIVPRSKVTFGLYSDPFKLIKINGVLDRIDVPEYFVSFVIYHEMLHHTCPGYVDKNGIHHMHTREFKDREKEFRYFYKAQGWIHKNRSRFFENSY